MSSPTEQRSPLIRFLDAFLQEDNIKWILGLGVCILLGSSLRLVTTHWHECTPVWKYLILIAYTGAVFALGQFSYHRLGLRKTGTVLMALTVLLIPLSFFALHWVRPQGVPLGTSWLRSTGLNLLLAINLVWSAFASHQIFRHFLRQTQLTFLISYLILCVAGAVVPGLPVAWAPVIALALWAVFAAGTVKVNRHIFWLTEEHRLPRIFGFFPISLLGAQFAAVFLLGLANQLTTAWMGLLCTLVALPILLTADAVARVFEQRTGGLVRPMPWSIIGPLFLGTILSAAGVVLALTGWPASTAVVPTAVLAAVAMGVVAHRTQKSAFVWGMVCCVMIAYQTSPVFFKELVLQLRDQAAAAVRESRLPYAFYGLTYAPLIIAFSLLANGLQRRGQKLFAGPLRKTASVLPWILFFVSFTHPSAVLPVALVLCPLFAGQAYLFRQRSLLIPAAMAFLAAAFGTPAFCQRVLGWSLSAELALFVWTVAAGLLFVPGRFVDRWSRSLPWSGKSESLETGSTSLCQLFSLLATLAAAGAWIVGFSGRFPAVEVGLGGLLPLLIGVLLTTHALRWLKPGLGEITLAFGSFAALRFILPDGGNWKDVVEITSVLLLVQWVLSYGLERIPQTRLAQAFRRPAIHVSFLGLSALLAMGVGSWIGAHAGLGSVPWLVSLMLVAWSLDAARRLESNALATIAWSTPFVLSTAALTACWGPAAAMPWWMAIWAWMGLTLLFLRQTVFAALRMENEVAFGTEAEIPSPFVRRMETWLSPLAVMLPVLFLVLAVVSLPIFGWPERLAGALALVGLVAAQRCRLCPLVTALIYPLANWQFLAAVTTCGVVSRTSIVQVTQTELSALGLPLATFAALSAAGFQWRRLRAFIVDQELQLLHELSLFLLSTSLLIGAVVWNVAGLWTAVDLAWAGVACLLIVAGMFASAVRRQSREWVWGSEAALLAAFGYFTVIGAWELTRPGVAYLCLACGLAFWWIGQAAAGSSRLAILSSPFQQTGFAMPMLVVPLALGRHFGDVPAAWAGLNSIPLLCAAAFYFWRGMAYRQLGTTLLSAVILNLAGALLWSELHWTDPQLFLMPIGISILMITELLNREISANHHDRLRLIGSLVILVSPTFHIVTGSWLHILTLMVAATAVSLIAIGLRIRVLLYTGTAFLLADLVALVARGSIEQPNLLWIVGVVLGGLVITLGAICENHRETVLARFRGMAAALEQWH